MRHSDLPPILKDNTPFHPMGFDPLAPLFCDRSTDDALVHIPLVDLDGKLSLSLPG